MSGGHRLSALGLSLVILLSVDSAGAINVRGKFSTLISGRQIVRNGESFDALPLYQLLALEVDDIGIPMTDRSRIVFQAWGRAHASFDEFAAQAGDLGALYLETESGPLTLRLGRQHLVQGVGRMDMVDGASAEMNIAYGVSAQGFFGWVSDRGFEYSENSWIGGGRIAMNLSPFGATGEVGIGYAHRREGDVMRRHELGIDGFTTIGPLRLLGLAVMNPEEPALVEGRLVATYTLLDGLVASIDGEYVEPTWLLPQTSIFSVFSDSARGTAGGDVRWDPSPYYSVSLAGHAVIQADGSVAYRATLGATTYRDEAHRSLLGADVRRLGERDGGYLRGRVFSALQLLDSLRVSGDVHVYGFDTPQNGESFSLLGQASVIYDLGPAARLVGTIAGGATPWAVGFVEGTARFVWGYDVDLAREVGP